MPRYICYAEIADAVADLPIELTEAELMKVSRQTLSTLKHFRLAGRNSAALWRYDDFATWLARRLKNAPEIFDEILLRLNAPVATNKKPMKVKKP